MTLNLIIIILIISNCLIGGISNFSFTLGLNLDNIYIGVICVIVKVDFILFILLMKKLFAISDNFLGEVTFILLSFIIFGKFCLLDLL